jgi:hypothetical protein
VRSPGFDSARKYSFQKKILEIEMPDIAALIVSFVIELFLHPITLKTKHYA